MPPVIDDEPEPEHIRCKRWREEVVRLSRPDLADLTGFSSSSIADIEAGYNRTTGKSIDPAVMKRYRMACAAAAIGVEFNWNMVRIVPTGYCEIIVAEKPPARRKRR